MKIESEKHRMDVRKTNIAGAYIVDARLDGATVDGIAVADPLTYWRVGHGAKSA
jgi:hypothetical protein